MRGTIAVGLAAIAVGLAAIAACARGDETVEYHLFAMGTSVDLTLPQSAVGPGSDILRAIEAELSAFERDYYAWGDGELAALNRELSLGNDFEVSPGMADLLADARRIAAQSEGAFEPGVGALVELWGFNGPDNPRRTEPAAAAIARLLEEAGLIADVTIDGTRIHADPASYTLDLGGIAKGEAVDRIVEMLAGRGVTRALVNAGGDLRVLGERPDRPWRIGVVAPRRPGLLGTITLRPGEAAFTSGDYERFVERDGARWHHILDPRTGYPATHTQAVTVIAPDGVTADAAATALFVAGPDNWERLASRLGIDAALRVDRSGRIEMTTSMRDRFQADADEPSDIIVATQ
jgi:thiamine biosynthesis lipoprotein